MATPAERQASEGWGPLQTGEPQSVDGGRQSERTFGEMCQISHGVQGLHLPLWMFSSLPSPMHGDQKSDTQLLCSWSHVLDFMIGHYCTVKLIEGEADIKKAFY